MYKKRLEHVAKVKKFGGVNHVKVLHDDWCKMLNGGSDCNCNPDVIHLGQHGEPGTDKALAEMSEKPFMTELNVMQIRDEE